MNRDTFSRYLAFAAIAVALFVGFSDDSCNCSGAKPRNLIWRILRLVVSAQTFEEPPAVQDPGATLYENSPPARAKGPTGEVELEHGRGW